MDKLRIYIFLLISILIGGTFIYSAYTKVLPIEVFEYTIVEYIRLSWLPASILSRALVGLETSLGILLLFNIYGKRKWVLKSAIAMLLIFSIYLTYLWIKVGNNINCGCFGDAIWMSPSSSLIKNAVMIVLLMILNRYHTGLNKKAFHIISIVTTVITVMVPYILFPMSASNMSFQDSRSYRIDFTPLYKPEKNDKPEVDLSKGKHVVAFLSLECPHCKLASQKMHLMKRDNPALSFYFIMNGDKKDLPAFFDNIKLQNISYSILLGSDFIDMAGLKQFGFNLPAIYLINNGVVESRSNYTDLDQATIENWLKKN